MDKFTIRFYPQATRELDRLPKEHAEMINDALPLLERDPFPRGKQKKKLRGKKFSVYRLRVNQYRVIYRIAGGEIFVLAVLPKRDADKFIKQL